MSKKYRGVLTILPVNDLEEYNHDSENIESFIEAFGEGNLKANIKTNNKAIEKVCNLYEELDEEEFYHDVFCNEFICFEGYFVKLETPVPSNIKKDDEGRIHSYNSNGMGYTMGRYLLIDKFENIDKFVCKIEDDFFESIYLEEQKITKEQENAR